MKDIVAQYRKHTFFQNSAIVVASLAIAFGINTYLLDGSVGNYLKSSVLDINGIEQTADIYGRVSSDRTNIVLGTQKQVNEIMSLSLSLIYDDSNVSLKNISSIIPEASITSISNEPGITTLLVTFSSPKTLDGESDILSIDVGKQKTGTAYLNILNANFKDNQEKDYLLSTSGILF